MFERNGKSVIYLWSKEPWGSKVTLSLPPGKQAALYLSPRQIKQTLAERCEFELKPGAWAQLEWLTKMEFEAALIKGGPQAEE